MWGKATLGAGMLLLGTTLATPVGAQETVPGTPGTPGAPICEAARVVEFKAGAARLSKDAQVTLDEVATATKTSSTRSVKLRGPKGPDEAAKPTRRQLARMKLAEKRADAVRSYLTDKGGVDASQITIASAGETEMQAAPATNAIEVVTCVAPVAEAPAPTPEPTPPAVAIPVPTPVPAEPTPDPMAAAPVPAATEMPPLPMPEASDRRRPVFGLGMGAAVGGGVTGFVDEQARDFTQPGGSWEARVSFGTRSPVAVEAAYIGSAQTIDALGLGSDAILMGNGAEATARVNFTRRAVVQPYIFGGVGWNHFSLQNEGSNTSSLLSSDDVLTVPFGVGIGFRLTDQLSLDVRGTGRAAFDDELMAAPFANTDQDARLHTWNALARVGFEF